MGLYKKLSPDTVVLLAALKETKSKEKTLWREVLPGLLQSVATAAMAGGIAVWGSYLGARQVALTQVTTESKHDAFEDDQQNKRDKRVDSQFLRDKAVDIITLVEKTPITNVLVTQAIQAMPFTPDHKAALPDDSARVTALVTLYFPTAVADARAYEAACANHIRAQTEILTARMQGKPPSTEDAQIYQDALNAGDNVTYDVMTAIDKTYQRRDPLSKSQVRAITRH